MDMFFWFDWSPANVLCLVIIGGLSTLTYCVFREEPMPHQAETRPEVAAFPTPVPGPEPSGLVRVFAPRTGSVL